MKKKILIFSMTFYPKPVGGAEVAIKEITDRTDPAEYEFHLISLRFDSQVPKVEQVGNITVHRIGMTKPGAEAADFKQFPLHLNKLFYQFQAAFVAGRLHRQHHFDAIWGMMAHSTGVPCGLFKTFHPSVGYALTLQEGDPPEYIEKKMRIFGPLFRRGFVKADVLQPISTFLGEWGKRMGFQKPYTVVPNAVNTAHFMQSYPEAELAAARTELGKKPSDTFLVTTSRLVHKNGVDDVIRAIAKLPPTVHFIVYGTGPDEAMLKDLIAELNVEDRVHMLGQLDHAVMPKYLKACDIFIRPSRSEGMGNSFVEAMAAELPVIATQEGGIADFLFDAKLNPDKPTTGWAVKKDTPDDIVAAVEDIVSHPEQVATVTATAKDMVVKQYDWNIIAADMERLVFAPVCEHK